MKWTVTLDLGLNGFPRDSEISSHRSHEFSEDQKSIIASKNEKRSITAKMNPLFSFSLPNTYSISVLFFFSLFFSMYVRILSPFSLLFLCSFFQKIGISRISKRIFSRPPLVFLPFLPISVFFAKFFQILTFFWR